eukprot:TRINITY_DN78_c0_g1_i1.p1 TRINITY_DN78_c0_g1~~TRINITY_DN78_c0_g1_i1.p1  ORF type:complete len:630 (+),score=235.66 TRINITY_DN78_c0_g1_i1:116-2005(+)
MPLLRVLPSRGLTSFIQVKAALSAVRRVASIPSGLRPNVESFVRERARLLKPDAIYVCDGSEAEYNRLAAELVKSGTLLKLNDKLRPNSYLARSDPGDVARVESKTFICSQRRDDAGPNNNWMAPGEMQRELDGKFDGAMRGRTMYVVPFCMGPLGSPIAHTAVQLTDSAYVAMNMRIMTRMGKPVLDALGDGAFVPCTHSVGVPLAPGQKDVAWPCQPSKVVVAHFPETREIWSFGSGYGGNALLGKKAFALRIASVMGRDEGWLAEHMLILSLRNDNTGRKIYVAAAFPSACGKTNLAMLRPSLPGWSIECVGDDIAWMKFDSSGRLRAINPEAGFFGVAPGTSNHSNPNAMATISRNTLFTNVALTATGDVWWEGIGTAAPTGLTDWTGKPFEPASGAKAAHANSRFTAPASQCPVIDPDWQNPAGVPISAIIFGGRRSATVPLVFETLSWQHGTFVGASMCSEQTAAAEGKQGELRRDPFAMLPFCGYNMADYWAHWLSVPSRSANASLLPKVFHVNWFRRRDGRFLWPGFGDNIRVLKWIAERCEGADNAELTPIGYVPKRGAIDTSGMSLEAGALDELLQVEPAGWLQDVGLMRDYLKQYGHRVPVGIKQELDSLEKRLKASS